MRKSPLKRKTPIRSKPKKREERVLVGKWLVRKSSFDEAQRQSVETNFTTHPATPQPKQLPGRSEDYKAFLRTKPCCVCGIEGRTEVAHQGRHGTGTKATDYGALPLCGTRVDRAGCHQISHTGGLSMLFMMRAREWYDTMHKDRYLAENFVAEHVSKLLIEYLEMLDKEGRYS